jgi:hypothetical protein
LAEIACGAFSEHAELRISVREQKARLLLANQHAGCGLSDQQQRDTPDHFRFCLSVK